MSKKSMYMNSENMKALAIRLNEKILAIENCYSEVKRNTLQIDGSNDYWKGNNQKMFYDYYSSMVDCFDENLEKFREFHKFLVSSIEEYEETEKDIGNDIDKNADNFDV